MNLPAFEFLRRDHDKLVKTKKRFRMNETILLLKQNRFEIEKATYRMPLLFIIILTQKFFRFFLRKRKIKSDLNETSKWINNLFYSIGKVENKLFKFY